MKITVKQLKQLIKEQIAGMDIDAVDQRARSEQRLRDQLQDEEVASQQELSSAISNLVEIVS